VSKLLVYRQKRAKVKRLIQQQLDGLEKDLNDVAVAASVTRQAVSATLNGYNNSARVLNALRQIGISEKYLFDPNRTKKVA